MLRASRRLLRRGGSTAFYTLHEPPGLPPRLRRQARAAGPRAIGTRSTYPRLLASAGFTAIDQVDVTAELRTTAEAWLAEMDRRAEAVAPLQPEGEFEQRQQERRRMIAAIDDGLIRRSLLLARRP